MTAVRPAALPPRLNRVLSHPLVRLILPVIVAGISVVVLHKLASHVQWTDVKADVAASGLRPLGLAVLFMLASFAALGMYDVLSVRSVARGKVPDLVAGLAGATGYAVSNMLGFSYLTGTAVRYRVYAALGLDLGRVAGVIATSWVGFWMGLLLVLGGLLVAHPVGLSSVLPLSERAETALGFAALAVLAAVYVVLWRGPRRVSLAGHGFDLPDLRLGAALTLVSVVDLSGAALTLYVLMPADLVQSYPYFFVVYVGAVALGILSHAPGGFGVFEASVIAGLGAAGRSDVLAALLLYRLIYTVLPFGLAALGLAVVWARTQHAALKGSAGWAYRLAKPIAPMAAAGISLLAGALLLASGALPGDAARLGDLRDLLPLPFIEASHLAGSMAGMLLIVLARGLYRKLWRAWVFAMGLMAMGFVASLAKGLDWEEALSLFAAFCLLGLFRGAFYRIDGASVFRLNLSWIVSLVALVAAIFWVGLFAYSHVAYRDALWWQFAWSGDASRFLRSSLVAALVLAGIALNSVLSARGRRTQPQPVPDAVVRLALAAEDSEAQIALSGDKAFLVAPAETAYLAYADTGRSLISKGDPVGDTAAGAALIWRLREQADRMGRQCAFYAVSPAYLPTYLDMGFSILKIGEVARVPLKGFTLEGSGKKDFRQARNRAARDGYVFEIIPAAQIAPVLPELRGVSDCWLTSKQGAEKGFALGAFDEAYLGHFDHAVLRAPGTGAIVAFANLMQGGNRHELSLDLMRHDAGAPGFAMDALFAEIMLWAAAQGFEMFSLGAAPFSGLENRQLASLWNRIGSFVYAHGGHFYHFEGLRAFKQKFDPEWTPNYLASPGGLAVPRILYEVNVLVSGGIRGLLK